MQRRATKAPKTFVLIIEDEAPIRDMVRYTLELEGFAIGEAGDAKSAQAVIKKNLPDLILLDWMLPGLSGIEIAKNFKRDALTRNIPLIMLTARAEEESKIRGFDIGVDDYIVKPFSPKELVARIRAVLRRGPLVSPEGKIEINDLCIDVAAHRVTIAGNIVQLSPIEYQLLRFLATHQDRVYSRGQLLNHVWGANVYHDERTVDVQIRRLRKALSQYDCADLIKTVRGSGYKFVAYQHEH